MTPAHSLKTTRSSHSAQYRRRQTYSDALKNPPPPPHWNSKSHSVANTQATEEFGLSLSKQKFREKVFKVFFLCVCVCFIFIIISKLARPGVMLKVERSQKCIKKEYKWLYGLGERQTVRIPGHLGP